jgi:type IV pilus assembly protein PilB
MAAMRMGELLVTKKIITSAQLDEALAEQDKAGRFLGEILVKRGWAAEEQVALGLSEQFGFAYVDLAKYNLEPGLVASLPQDIAKRYLAIPIFRSATTVTVAMANPLNSGAIDVIQEMMKAKIRPVFAIPSQISRCIAEEYTKAIGEAPSADMGETEISKLDSMQVVSLAPVVSTVDDVISRAVELGASDIHLEPQGEHFYCRMRIDGVLHDMPQLPKKYETAIISRIKIMANMDIAERRLPQDGRVQTQAGKKNIDLRISTFPTVFGENMVMRILDRAHSLLTLKDLGMVGETLKKFEQMIVKPHGIILVTGPTGSGKTTTLYAVLNKINSIEKNIITLEDPVEYEIERVRQSQVNVKAGLTFASGLRSIVRQDPDVIMIGEIRDRETAEIAIQAALTGHLVFSTLHTNDAASSATRLVDIGVEPFLVSSSIICIVAQRLMRVLCPDCKEAYAPGQELLDELKMPNKPGLKFYREKGCRRCHDSGFGGRTGIFEMFVPEAEIGRLIERKASANEIRDCAIRAGMKTLREDGIDKLINGITSLSELLRVTQEV